MNFKKALQILGIEKYGERIFNSNSHGEMFHLQDYFLLAKHIGKTDWFAEWFECMVKQAEENWDRPESIFQHILTVLDKDMQQ